MTNPQNRIEVRVALLGIPTDVNSSFRRGPARGPTKIREILQSEVGNSATEGGLQLGEDLAFNDVGDVEIREEPADAGRIVARIGEMCAAMRFH